MKLYVFCLCCFFILACTNHTGGVAPSQQTSSTNTAPVSNNITPPAFDEDTESLITLSYTDAESHQATSCAISNASQVSQSQPCSCSSGVCSVGVIGAGNFNGNASFNFVVTANGLASNTAIASFNIVSVPDISGSLTTGGAALTNRAKQSVFSALTFDENITTAELCLSQDSNNNGVLDISERCNMQNYLNLTAALSASGTSSGATWNSYYLQSGVDAASFSLTPSCGSTTSYFTTLQVTNSVGRSARINSAAWSFWSPSCLSTNLVLWLDAIDSTTLFSNSGCTTAAVNNGPVGCWQDKSGSSYHVTQATLSLQPTYIAASNKINFNGSTVLMGPASSNPYAVTSDRGVFTVFQLNTSIPGGGYIADRTTATNELFGIFRTGQLEVRNNTGSGYQTIGAVVSVGSPVNWGGTLSGTTASQYLNGSLSATGTITGTINQPGVAIGRHATTTTSYSLDFNEYILVNTNPLASDLSKIQGYLAWKWGIQSSLPSGHSYKNIAP